MKIIKWFAFLLAVLLLCGCLAASGAQADEHQCGELRWVAEKAAGCEDGNVRYGVCDGCGTWYSEAFPDGIVTNHADVIIPGTGHNPSPDWSSDVEGHWHDCMNPDCTARLDFAAHTPEADDNDSTTPIQCAVCRRTLTEAKTHTSSSDWQSDVEGHWHTCANAGCTARVGFAAHTPEKDDKDCTTPILCSACGKITTPAKKHSTNAWVIGSVKHWRDCKNAGCNKTYDYGWHTSEADDGNCTTPILCSVCGGETTAAKKHVEKYVTINKDYHKIVCANQGCNFVIKSSEDHSYLLGGWGSCEKCGFAGGRCVSESAYNSSDSPEMWALRRFRDDTLAKTAAGRQFIMTYYAVRPTLVKWLNEAEWAKPVVRTALDAVVAALRERGVEDTPYKDLDWRSILH